MSKRLNGSIALSKLQSALMKTKQGNEAIVIPIDSNYLVRGKDGAIYLNIQLWINDEEDAYGNIASVKQNGQIQGKKWSELTEEEQNTLKNLPYLGNLKDFSDNASSSDSEGLKNSDPVGEDDLPF